jgi:uncharacterized protein DUF6919
MNRRERRQWRSARTLGDLGRLMARWLEGDLQARPGYYGPTDLDTPELTALCAALCREGLITDNSQQGGHWIYQGRSVRARASIDGFADDAVLRSLRGATQGTELIVTARRTRSRRWWRPSNDGGRIVVTEVDGRISTEFGGQLWPGCMEGIWDGIGKQAYREVMHAWHIAVVDPEWGRNDLLIDTLTSRFLSQARNGSCTPVFVEPVAARNTQEG